MEVRCCCEPGNLLGEIDYWEGLEAGLKPRELDDGTYAFPSHGTDVNTIPGFVRTNKGKGGKKTWRKK